MYKVFVDEGLVAYEEWHENAPIKLKENKIYEFQTLDELNEWLKLVKKSWNPEGSHYDWWRGPYLKLDNNALFEFELILFGGYYD